MTDYGDVNQASWDERVPAHLASPEYSVERFYADPGFLSGVVRFDTELLGSVAGLRGVHLQCHIGTDTVSLARLGASMTAVDFSGPAIAAASQLAAGTGADARFMQSDVYGAVDGLLVVRYPYFEQAEPQVWDEGGTYVTSDAVFEHNVTHEWNHGLGEIVTALLDAGLKVTGLAEHDSVSWNALPGLMTESDGEWRLTDTPARLPCSYTLQAVRQARP